MVRKRLGMRELESRVMDVLWNADRPLTPGEVQEGMGDDRELAYTTVMTVLVRLWKKEMVSRKRQGRAYSYLPIRSREEQMAERIRQILAAAGNRSDALASFVQALDRGDKAKLRRLLDNGRKKG